MKKITTYLSKDGMLFEDYEKCLDHEINFLMRKKEIIFFSRNGNELESGYDFSYLFDNCSFIKISKEAWETFSCFCEEEAFIYPQKYGVWKFDEEIDDWVGVEADILRTATGEYFLNEIW